MSIKKHGVELFIIMLLLAFPVYAEHAKPYDPSRNAFNDYEDALALSQSKHKNIFISIGGNWCIYCLQFNENLKKSDCYQIIQNNYIYLSVNYSKENKNKEFFSLFPKINGYPYFIIVSTEGKVLEHALASKYKLEKEFRKMLKSHIN